MLLLSFIYLVLQMKTFGLIDRLPSLLKYCLYSERPCPIQELVPNESAALRFMPRNLYKYNHAAVNPGYILHREKERVTYTGQSSNAS